MPCGLGLNILTRWSVQQVGVILMEKTRGRKSHWALPLIHLIHDLSAARVGLLTHRIHGLTAAKVGLLTHIIPGLSAAVV